MGEQARHRAGVKLYDSERGKEAAKKWEIKDW